MWASTCSQLDQDKTGQLTLNSIHLLWSVQKKKKTEVFKNVRNSKNIKTNSTHTLPSWRESKVWLPTTDNPHVQTSPYWGSHRQVIQSPWLKTHIKNKMLQQTHFYVKLMYVNNLKSCANIYRGLLFMWGTHPTNSNRFLKQQITRRHLQLASSVWKLVPHERHKRGRQIWNYTEQHLLENDQSVVLGSNKTSWIPKMWIKEMHLWIR